LTRSGTWVVKRNGAMNYNTIVKCSLVSKVANIYSVF